MPQLHVADRLQRQSDRTGSIACVGIDPRPHLIPPRIKQAALAAHDDTAEGAAAAFRTWGCSLIEAIADRCAAIKPQLACFEAYGSAGWRALESICATARDLGVPVILDAKRGDIGSTAAHYQQGLLGHAVGIGGGAVDGLRGDWVTINGYMGHDAVQPFIDAKGEHGAFVLVKTSNPSSADLQDRPCEDITVMERMAELVRTWGAEHLGRCGLSSLGAVVGATFPDQARMLRKRMPDTLFLVPGYGAQGGSAADALAGLRGSGDGVLVNSSRGIIGAWEEQLSDWRGACVAALEAMNQDLNAAR